MKLKIILSILFCLITNHIFAKDFYIRELRDSSGRKIFYIDMNHIGTKEYFVDVHKNIENIFYSNKNVNILKEGLRLCARKDAYYYNINLNSGYIPKIPLDHEIEYYKDNNLPFIQDMIANNFLKKYHCNEEQGTSESSDTIKPQYFSHVNDVIIYQYPYLDDEFVKIKENDNEKFSVLNDVFIDLSNASIFADIILSELPIFYKFMVDLFNMDIDTKKKIFSDAEIVKLKFFEDKIAWEYRDNQTLLNIFNTFYVKNTDAIILLWGSSHYAKLSGKLEEKGFKEIASHKLKYFECHTLKNEKVFNFLTADESTSLDILLQCGSTFDPNGEVLIQTKDKVEGKTTIVTISPSALEWKYEYDAKTASDSSNKLLNNKFYKDGSRQWSFQVGDKVDSYALDKEGKLTRRFEMNGKIYLFTYDQDGNLLSVGVQ